MYISTYIQNKNCHQPSYGFQILMSSWGWGSKFSIFLQVGDFSIFGSNSVTFYFSVGFFFWVSFVIKCCPIPYRFPSGSTEKPYDEARRAKSTLI